VGAVGQLAVTAGAFNLRPIGAALDATNDGRYPNNVMRLAAITVGLLAGLLAAPSLPLGARCPQGDCVETQGACARTAVSCTTAPACCTADSNRTAVSTERERAPVDSSAALPAASIASSPFPQAAIDRTPYFPAAPHPLFLWVRALLI